MLRTIAGAIVGYLVIVLAVFATFVGVYTAMGADLVFADGTFEASALWVMVSFVLGLIASIAGGTVCAMIARSERAGFYLAGLVLVLGLAGAVPAVMAPAPEMPVVREGPVGFFEAIQHARNPAWVALMNPVIGVVGVLIGARLRRGSAGP